MSLKALLVVLALGVVAWPGAGHAEKAKTNQITKLYSRAGEQSPVLLKVKSGQTMTILVKDGRWIKVRVSGRTGWIPRSKIDLPPEDEEISRNTRRRPFVDGRGTKRGFGGEAGPDDRVGADATGDGEDSKPGKSGKAARDEEGDEEDRPAKGSRPSRGKASKAAKDEEDEEEDKPAKGSKKASKAAKDEEAEDDEKPARTSRADDDAEDEVAKEPARPMAHVSKATSAYNEPSAKSDESFKAMPRTALYVVEEKGKWTFVENDEGDAGYVLTSKLDIDDAGAGGPRVRAIDVRGRIGFALIKQSLKTPGGSTLPPDNYSAGSSSVTVALGGSVLYPYAKRYWIGGELAYDFDKTVFGGIVYKNSTTSFSYHNLNLRAVVGYDLQKASGMLVFGRLGYHYDSFQVADFADPTKNTATLPNQIISAPTLGAALVIPRLTKMIALKVSLDAVAFGASVSQTKNLEDGTGPSAKAVYLGAAVNYRWKPRMDLQATFDVAYTSLSFSGPPPATSTRMHTGTGNSSGSDFNNTLSVGATYAF